MKYASAALILTLLLWAPATAGWKGPTMYDGTPDLKLTAEMVAAGGGPAHFDSERSSSASWRAKARPRRWPI